LHEGARTGKYDNVDSRGTRRALLNAISELNEAARAIGAQISLLESQLAEAPEAFEEAELKELRARHWVRENYPAVQQRLAVMQSIRALEVASRELSSTPLTTLSKRIAAELVTDQLMGTLRSQLAQVGLGYLQAQVVSSGRQGVTTIRLAPPEKAFKKTDMSRVLSEGEQALMGLAAFLAELEIADHRGPIILDDPVSGLDAENRALMAERVAKLAILHQVLVMTHDDGFVADLQDAAARTGCEFVRRSMSRRGDEVGVVVE